MGGENGGRPVFGVELLPDGSNQLDDVLYEKNIREGVEHITINQPKILNT